MAQNIRLMNADWLAVPQIDVPKTTSGYARFTDASVTTAVESDVASGKIFIKANGSQATGTNSGGSAKNVQVAQATTRSTSSAYTEVISLTCLVSGTYDVYWSTFRSSTSGTWGSRLYINDEAYGTADTGNWSNHIQNKHLTNVELSANDDVAVRVRSRGNNYYGYVGTLTIIQK